MQWYVVVALLSIICIATTIDNIYLQPMYDATIQELNKITISKLNYHRSIVILVQHDIKYMYIIYMKPVCVCVCVCVSVSMQVTRIDIHY